MENFNKITEEVQKQIDFYKNINTEDSKQAISYLEKVQANLNNDDIKSKLENISLSEGFKLVSQVKEDKQIDTKDNHNLADAIIDALGGGDNILDIDACITKLRLQIKDKSKVIENDAWKEKYGALGTVMGKETNGSGMQIAYGPRADVLKGIMNEKLDRD